VETTFKAVLKSELDEVH